MQRAIIKNKRLITLISGILVAAAYLSHYLLHNEPGARVMMLVASIIGVAPIALQAFQALRVKVVSIDVLVTIAVIGALIIGNYEESAVVTFLFLFGDYLELRTLNKTRSAIRELTEMAPESALKLMEDGSYEEVEIDEVDIGDTLRVLTGAKVPVDGRVLSGEGHVNEASITGEAVPVHKVEGAQVFAGTILDNGTLHIVADRVGEDTTFGRIIELVEEAQDAKSEAERFIDRFSKWYTPAVLVLAVIDSYKKNFQVINEQELYKWQAVKHFQDNWNPNAKDFGAMVKNAFGKHVNLLNARNYFPLGVLNDIAAENPEKLREMFAEFYDESISVSIRADNFTKQAKDFVDGKNPGVKKQHYQDLHAISVYLAFRYPEKYQIFKTRVFTHFAELIGYSPIPKMGQFEMLEEYFRMCDMIRERILQDKELLDMSKARLSEDCYQDPEYRMLTTDIVYYGRLLELPGVSANPWWPDLETYDPGITEEEWAELLKDDQVFDQDAQILMKRMLDIGGEATCKQLSDKYGKDFNYYRNHSLALAKRVCDKTSAPTPPDSEDGKRWWPVLYVGRKNTEDTSGVFTWRLRPELKAALEKHDQTRYPLHEQDIPQPPREKQYFWLNEYVASVGHPESLRLDSCGGENGQSRRFGWTLTAVCA